MKSLISICIATHNNVSTIKRAIESALSQNTDKEIVIVDDGSEDGTELICDNYSRMFENIVVVHSAWKGLVNARQKCIDNSRGEYITFLDADDWIDHEFCKYGVERLENNNRIDIVVLGMISEREDGQSVIITKTNDEVCLEKKESIQQLFKWDYFRWELCGKIYKKDLFKNVITDTKVTVCEDLDKNWSVFQKVNKVLFVSSPYYHYIVNPDSMTKKARLMTNSPVNVFYKIWKSNPEFDRISKNCFCNKYLPILRDDIRDHSFNNKRDDFSHIKMDKQYLKELFADYWNVDERNIEAYNSLLNYSNSEEIIWKWYEPWINFIDGIPEQKNIWVYGAGLVAGFFIELTKRRNREISGVVVTRRTNEYFVGYRIKEYTELKLTEDDIIVLAMLEHNQQSVLNQLSTKKNTFCLKSACAFGI